MVPRAYQIFTYVYFDDERAAARLPSCLTKTTREGLPAISDGTMPTRRFPPAWSIVEQGAYVQSVTKVTARLCERVHYSSPK